ncbi:DNA-directed RNA polymerase subunit beta [Paenibacillus sp. CAA11]|uniref:DNA-directed RNA polymerase subunit beta n=1 Tax=Paenibacillus sp. CAA11 TaxID=1532905 RepID=UPI000D3D0099|nr:DNA-directed RNA polymerase subunit beta [Paenibacillus sp. CAA11]AWB46261.1 DNA-directed RNA polymerase subunit beta [Paenibacillus sp. CAA11]
MTEATEETKPTASRRGLRRTLKVISVVLFLLLAGYAGMAIGYVVLGKQPWSDIFLWSTWRHVFDLIFAP